MDPVVSITAAILPIAPLASLGERLVNGCPSSGWIAGTNYSRSERNVDVRFRLVHNRTGT